jgi:hypothetical protein
MSYTDGHREMALKDIAEQLKRIADKLNPNPIIPENIPVGINFSIPMVTHCIWDEIMKDPNNWGKPFGIVCNCPRCSPRCTI